MFQLYNKTSTNSVKKTYMSPSVQEMEKFKAVEKEMKTKAFSKEGLSAAAKLDPKERERQEASQFLSGMVEELERQIETLEAEDEALNATVKKGKKDTSKSDRLGEISRLTERHKWHQGKLELLLRSLENGNVDIEQVHEREDGIKYYVEENQTVEFMEDDTLYDDLNLDQEEGVWGINNDNDKVSSQDNQSVQDEIPETADGRGSSAAPAKTKQSSISETQGPAVRRPSNQLKSPLPALATLHTPMVNNTNGTTPTSMKPAPLPTRAPGETLKYASAAAAAAASDKNAVGIAPLPPPPGSAVSPAANTGLSPLPQAPVLTGDASISPKATNSLPANAVLPTATKATIPPTQSAGQMQPKSPSSSQPSAISVSSNIPPTPALEKSQNNLPPSSTSRVTPIPKSPKQDEKLPSPEPEQPITPDQPAHQPATDRTNGEPQIETEDTESIFHLPPGLQDLISSFEITRSKPLATPSQSVQRLLSASLTNCPDVLDSAKPQRYRPQSRYNSPRFYPQEPSNIIDDPNLYGRIDTDTLFYIFYYRQGSYQQYLAAKSLKSQSWRFHKQYQTWFQRHEEPKSITDEYEQGTYRFFDYESTWYDYSRLFQALPLIRVLSLFAFMLINFMHRMNRRKADFKFAYKFLEDDL